MPYNTHCYINADILVQYQYLAIIILTFIGYSFFSSEKEATEEGDDENKDPPDPPRNFTAEQLKHFDGTSVADDDDDLKPVYLSINGIVFDTSAGRNFYGPGGPYEIFAGHECGVALAKMSFDTEFLDDLEGCQKLNFGEREELDNWSSKFSLIRCYPIKGRLVPDNKLPSSARTVTKQELEANNGAGKVPDGYATAPIYLGAGDKVYDVSFGGVGFYGTGGPYNRFAGKNASRALALMSFDPADCANTSVDDLSDKQKKVLADWIKTFEEKKGYPCVGGLEKNKSV